MSGHVGAEGIIIIVMITIGIMIIIIIIGIIIIIIIISIGIIIIINYCHYGYDNH